jgi:hypothetical protein
MELHLSSQLISSVLFTSYLCSSKVPSAGDSFLFLPKFTGSAYCGPAASSRLRGGERKGAPATQPDAARTRRIRTTRPGPQLAERARRAVPDPQHGLAGMQRDLSYGRGQVFGSLRVNERSHPAGVRGTSQVRRAVHRGQVH